jgi:hypothetical protein
MGIATMKDKINSSLDFVYKKVNHLEAEPNLPSIEGLMIPV